MLAENVIIIGGQDRSDPCENDRVEAFLLPRVVPFSHYQFLFRDVLKVVPSLRHQYSLNGT